MLTHTDTKLRPQYTLRPIKHGDQPPPVVVRHQLPAMCCREETPAPEQKIYSSITIRPDMNILPLHFHTARRIIPLTENKCIIRGSSTWSFKVSAHFYGRVVSAPTPRSPAALAPTPPCFLSAHWKRCGWHSRSSFKVTQKWKISLTLLAKCPQHDTERHPKMLLL